MDAMYLDAFPGPAGAISLNGTVVYANNELEAFGIHKDTNVLAGLQPEFLQMYSEILMELCEKRRLQQTPKLYKELVWHAYFFVAYIGMLEDMIVFYAFDESKLRQATTSLLHDASIDPLTGLFNRRQFLREVSRYILPDGHIPFVIFFDIDHFKKVNDTYGHDAGDDILKFVAQTVQMSLRINDILARAGGEEFLIYGSSTDVENVRQIAERMRKIIEQTPAPAHIQNAQGEKEEIAVPVHISVGIDFGRRPVDELITHSDIALYHSKENGRNQTTIYCPGMVKTSKA